MTPAHLVDLPTERHLLGALILTTNRPLRDTTLAHITPADLHSTHHQHVLAAITEVHNSGNQPDPVLVADAMQRAGHHDPNDTSADPAHLNDLAHNVPYVGNLDGYTSRLRDLARRRHTAATAHALAEAAQDLTCDLDDSVSTHVDRIVTPDTRTGVVTVQDVLDELHTLHAGGSLRTAVDTGWRNLDRVYGPVPSHLTVVAGHPSVGKGAFLSALAVNTARLHGWRTVFWAPEDAPTARHAARLAAIYTGLPFERIPEGPHLEDALGWVHEHFVWVDHRVYDRVSTILAKVAALHAKAPVHQFVVDPWQNLDARRPSNMREDEHINAELTKVQGFAELHGMHAVVATHPRNLERGKDDLLPVVRPEHIRGGSFWRSKADELVSLWRDETGGSRPAEIVDVHVLKVKVDGHDGRMGAMTQLRFDGATGRYHPLMQVAV